MKLLINIYKTCNCRKIIFLILISLTYYHGKSQSGEVEISLIRPDGMDYTEWYISDEYGRKIFDGNNFYQEDSVYFFLQNNERFFLSVTINQEGPVDSILFILRVNGQTLYIIPGDTQPGDHHLPFQTSFNDRTLKITGGTNADIADFPWQVLLLPGKYLCGGTIISEKWVITAAHCLFDEDNNLIKKENISIRAGASNPFRSNVAVYEVDSVIVHESYTSFRTTYDIALLRISDSIKAENAEPIEFVVSEDIENGATDPGVLSQVTGWGLTRVDPDLFPDILQKVQLPVVSNSVAASVWGNVPESFLMAGYKDGGKDACSGDSGGPLVVPVGDSYKLAGIVSWGSEDCDTYGAYIRVSYFERWIKNKTGIGDEYKPSAPQGESFVCQGVETSSYFVSSVDNTATYEWTISPEESGTLNAYDTTALIIWNKDYTGEVKLRVRTVVDTKVSSWTEKSLRIAENTVLRSQSNDKTACEGDYVSLEMNAKGYLLSYDWYQDDKLVQSGSSDVLTLFNSLPENSGVYRAEISGACGDTISDELFLRVFTETEIISFSQNQNVNIGRDARIEVQAEGHELNYYWEKDGVFLDNNDPELIFNSVNANNIGLYNVRVEGTCGTESSETSYLFVNQEVKNDKSELISVWPTYTNDIVNVAYETDEKYEIFIYDLKGSLLLRSGKLSYNSAISIGLLREGMYLFNIRSSSVNETYRILKNNF